MKDVFMKDIIMPGLWIGLFSILFIMLVFLIFRELVCWYWKINERVNLQKRTNLILRKILEELHTTNLSNQTSLEKKSELKNKVKILYQTKELHFPEK